MIRQGRQMLLTLLFAGAALWAAAQGPSDDSEQNRERLEALRKNPEQLARLRENMQQFLALPEKRREKIVQLDRELHGLPASKQTRYFAMLQRYADWLDQLRQDNPAAFKAIKEAPNAAARLSLIKAERDHEWMQTRPNAQREEWAKLQGKARSDYVAKLRQEELTRHYQWVVAQRFWKELETRKELPCRLSDYSEKVKNYVKYYLMPKLSPAEAKQLKQAEGRWPDYPMALVEIASKRPAALPPAAERPRKFDELPEPIQKYLRNIKGKDAVSKKLLKQYTLFNGSPNFASKVVQTAREHGKALFENEYLACSFQSLQRPMKEFVNTKLVPALKDTEDNRKFAASEGKWPDYPETIQELSRKYHLQPPWLILPEPERWKWDNYRHLKRSTEQAKPQQES